MNTVDIISPYHRDVIDTLPLMSLAQVQDLIATADHAFQDKTQWLTKAERIEILERFLTLLVQHADELITLAAREGGKPYQDSKVEVERAQMGVRYAISALQTQAGREIPMQISQATLHRRAYTFHEPIGLVFAISAFNHPVNLIIHQVIPAIATGCPVIIKPASKTPLSCQRIVELLHLAGVHPKWLQFCLCDNKITAKLISDARIKFLSFIGSAHVGWELRRQLAPGATCTLEHGGAAPVILDQNIDLQKVLPLLSKGGFYHAGQVCVSVQRIFAPAKQAKSISKKLAELAKKLKVGDPLNRSTDVGPLISPDEVTRVEQWVQESVYEGAKVMVGGKKISDTCYAPTVLYNPSDQSKVSTAEIFGPVICVYPYKDLNEAIARANQLPFCFQASVFTEQLNFAFECTSNLKANTVLVNDMTAFRADWMPFGGREQSGLGLGGIPDTMNDLSHEKLMIFNADAL